MQINMAEDEMKFRRNAEKLFMNGQIEQAKGLLMYGLKICPESIELKDLLQRYRDIKVLNIPDSIQQENGEVKQGTAQIKTELHQITNNYEVEQGINEIKEKDENDTEFVKKLLEIANNSFAMRLKVLGMEVKVVETFLTKELIKNGNYIQNNKCNIENCLAFVIEAQNIKNLEQIYKQLDMAERSSTELMRKIKMVVKKNTVKKEEVKKPEDDIEIPDYRSIVTVRGSAEDVKNCILKATRALENGKYDRAESLLLKAERIFPTVNARDLLKQVRASKELKENPNPMEIATEAVEQVDTIKEDKSKPGDGSINAIKCLTVFEKAFSAGNFNKAERMLNKAKRFDPELDIESKLSQVKSAVIKKTKEEQQKEQMKKVKNDRIMAGVCLYKAMKAYYAGDFKNAKQIFLQTKSYDPTLNLEREMLSIRSKMASESSKKNKELGKTNLNLKFKTVPAESVTESKMVPAAEYLYNANKAYDAGDFKAVQRNLVGAKKCDSYIDLEPYFLNCSAEIASRSLTEGDAVIPKKIPNTIRTNNQNDYELCKHYVKEAETAYRNRNLSETTRLLKMAKTCHLCIKVNEMLERVENLKYKYPAKPSHEITTSETKFSCLEDEKQKEIEMQLVRQKVLVEKEMSKDDQLEMNETCKDKKYSIKNENTKLDTQVKKDTTSDRRKFDKDNKEQTPNRVKLHKIEPLVKQARHFIGNGEFELAKVVLLNAQDIHASSSVKSLMEEVEKGLENDKRSNYSSKCKVGLKTTKSSRKDQQVKTLTSLAEKAMNDKNIEEATNFLNSAEELYPRNEAKALIKSVNEIKISHRDTTHLNCYEFPSETNESDKAEALQCITLAQAAYQEGRNEKAERLLLKSLRICDSQKAKSFLENVRNAIAQNNTTLKTEKQYYSLSERNNDYSKCIELAEKGVARGDLAKAEHLLSKAIRINPNDGAKEQLENIRRVRLSQSSSNKVREQAEMFVNLGLEARNSKKFNVAYIYIGYAYKKQPNECTLDLLRNAQTERDISNGRHSPSNYEFLFEANRLLDKAENFIRTGDLEKAESFIIVSWDMKKTRRTTRVHKKFLEARLNLFNGDKKHERGERYNEKSEKIFESDQLVMLALDKYKNNKQFKETEKLLMRAAEFNPSDLIEKLLYEIRDAKNNEPGVVKKIYNYVHNFF